MGSGVSEVGSRLRRMLGRFGSAGLGTPGRVMKPTRDRLQKYLQGRGIEIGALHNPMRVNTEIATVRYVDLMSLEEQRAHYPELAGYDLVRPDILASGDAMPMLADNSEDFVIANHVMEHLPDPIGALKEWFRVLKPGGILFLALPDKRKTFDRDRPRTTLSHLIDDYADRGARSRLGHFEEYSRLVHRKTGDELQTDIQDLLDRNYSIHFHVWVPDDIAELLAYLRDRETLPWKVVERIDDPGTDEFINILEKPH